MFGLRRSAQPKDAYEQPGVVVEEVPEQDAEPLPISPFTGEPYDPAWGQQIIPLNERLLGRLDGSPYRPKANPSIISTVWK